MALLRHRDFLLLFAGQGVSRLGDGLYTAVVAWLAWSLTRQPGAVALVTVAAYAPTFLATLIGASYADRYDRRRLMIATDLVRAAVVALAPRLLEANGLLQVAFRAAFFVGPLLLAPLLAIASLELVLALDVLTFLASAATLAAIRVRPAARAEQPIGLRADLAAGFTALRAEPQVLIVITTFILALL